VFCINKTFLRRCADVMVLVLLSAIFAAGSTKASPSASSAKKPAVAHASTQQMFIKPYARGLIYQTCASYARFRNVHCNSGSIKMSNLHQIAGTNKVVFSGSFKAAGNKLVCKGSGGMRLVSTQPSPAFGWFHPHKSVRCP
jgi:hypothetical protein